MPDIEEDVPALPREEARVNRGADGGIHGWAQLHATIRIWFVLPSRKRRSWNRWLRTTTIRQHGAIDAKRATTFHSSAQTANATTGNADYAAAEAVTES